MTASSCIGTVETPREPIDARVTVIIRQRKHGTQRHFEMTNDLDPDGWQHVARELLDDPLTSPRSAVPVSPRRTNVWARHVLADRATVVPVR